MRFDKPGNHKHLSIVVLFTALFAISGHTYSAPFVTAIVKLYSEGRLVGKWEAINEGHMEGPCFVFKIRKSIHTPQVRVCGTFSVENKK